jgi:hypothetical protein
MEDLKIFEEVSVECDEKGTMEYQGGHSHGTIGLLDAAEAPIPFDGYRQLDATVCAERVGAAKATLADRLVVLVHHYQRNDVYQFADLTGDSFKLSQQAARLVQAQPTGGRLERVDDRFLWRSFHGRVGRHPVAFGSKGDSPRSIGRLFDG